MERSPASTLTRRPISPGTSRPRAKVVKPLSEIAPADDVRVVDRDRHERAATAVAPAADADADGARTAASRAPAG